MVFEVTAAAVRAARLDGPSGPQPSLPDFTVRSVKGGKGFVGGFASANASTRRQCGFVGGSIKDLMRGGDGQPRIADKDADFGDADRRLRCILECFASVVAVRGGGINARKGMLECIGNGALRGFATEEEGG